MSETVIKIDNLGKKYRLGSVDTGYKTFRETILDATQAPFLRTKEAWSMAHRAWSRQHEALSREHGGKAKDASSLPAPDSSLPTRRSLLAAPCYHRSLMMYP